MEAIVVFVAVAALILLAVTSMRYGVDSREGFASRNREPAAHGIGRAESSATAASPVVRCQAIELRAGASGAKEVRLCLVRRLIADGSTALTPTSTPTQPLALYAERGALPLRRSGSGSARITASAQLTTQSPSILPDTPSPNACHPRWPESCALDTVGRR